MSKKEEELKGWVATQHRTFTRWCNMILAKHPDKLELKGLVYPPDFASGYPLLVLLECLVPAHKQFKSQQDHDNIKKAATRFVQLDSTTRGFQFLKDSEHFNFVNVGPTDIVDSNLKITLGFIWQLILHYQIAQKLSGESKQKDVEAAKSAAKKNLLDWVNSQIVPQGVSGVNNFGKDWNSGIALSALNESLYPEMQDLDAVKKRAGSEEGRLENAKEALGVAVGTMGLPRLIEPEDLVAPEPDELSLMTLISVYRENVERIKGVRNSGLAAEEARRRAEEEKRRAEREAAEEKRRAEEEARRRAEEEARHRAEEEARHKAEEEARRRADQEAAEAKRRAEEEARHRAEEEARRRKEEEEKKRLAAEAEAARRRAEEEARRKAAEDEARRLAAEAEARRRAEEEERNRKPPKKQFVMSLKSNMNHYLSAEKEMNQVVANRDRAQIWEYFVVEPLDATGVPVRLRTWHGSYLVANENASVSAYSVGQYPPGADVWFITREQNQSTVVKTGYGGVLTAQEGWGGAVIITNDASNPMANWRMTKIKAVNLRSYFGKFLRADKKGEVVANKDDAGENETWTMERAPVSSGPGKAYYFKSYHGKYLCAELKKFKIVADRENPAEWETWWVTKEGQNGQVTLRSYHGKYLCSEKKKGEVIGDRDKAGEWEQWTMFSKDLTKGSKSGMDWFGK